MLFVKKLVILISSVVYHDSFLTVCANALELCELILRFVCMF